MDNDEFDYDTFDVIDYLKSLNNEDQTPQPKTSRNLCTNPQCQKSTMSFDNETGLPICTSCGHVFDVIVDGSGEYASKNDNYFEGKSCINSTLLPQSSLSGNLICGSSKARNIYNWSCMPPRERTLNNIFRAITQVCDIDKVPKKVEEDTKILIKKISDAKYKHGSNIGKYIITRGTNRLGLLAACYYYACQRNEVPRSKADIAKFFSITENKVGIKKFNEICANIGFNCESWVTSNDDSKKKSGQEILTSQVSQFIKKYCQQLNIENALTTQALTILKNIYKLKIGATHSTEVLSSVILLMVIKHNNCYLVTKDDLCKIAEISKATLSKVYNEFEKYTSVLINDNLVNIAIEKINKKLNEMTISNETLLLMKHYNITN